MSYENIGTPSGNNLYITIPLRGTQNWDERLKEGFFQKVSDHDHTPGKGAAIVEAALDAAVRNKLDQIAVNTSEIAQNAIDISQNAAEILTNAQDINANGFLISQNQTDIGTLDTRVTTEVSSINTNITALDTRLSTAELDVSSATNNINQLQTDVATNASNITSLTTSVTSTASDLSTLQTDVATNSSNILTSTQVQSLIDASTGNFIEQAALDAEVASLDSDIAGLNTRVTTLESGGGGGASGSYSASYNLTNVNAQNDLPAFLLNADVLISGTSTTITGKEFQNVRISLDCNATFDGCTFRNCYIGESDDVANPWNVTFRNSCEIYGTEVFSMNTVSIDNSDFFRGSIKAVSLDIDNTSATVIKNFETSVVKLTSTLTIRGNSSYRTDFLSNDVTCTLATFNSGSDDAIYLSNTRIDTLRVNSDGNYLITSSISVPTIICHETSTSGSIFKLRNISFSDIANLSGTIAPFKIVDGVYSVYDKGLVPSGTPSNGDTLVYNSTSGEWESAAPSATTTANTEVIVSGRDSFNTTGNADPIITSSSTPLYDPNTNINASGEVTLAAGNYLLTVRVDSPTSSSYDLSVRINGSINTAGAFQQSTGSGEPLGVSDYLISASANDVLLVDVDSTSPNVSITTVYTLKKLI